MKSVALSCCIVLTVLMGQWAAGDMSTAKEQENSIGMKLVRIEPGAFHMGNGESPPRSEAEWQSRDWDESPAHVVKISQALFIGAYGVGGYLSSAQAANGVIYVFGTRMTCVAFNEAWLREGKSASELIK
jgi:hypothetical protein